MFNILPNYSSQASLTQSGANLYTYITSTSGNLDFRLYQTGLNLGNRLYQTGADLRALITAASNGVSTLNSISGVIDIIGTGEITVFTNGQMIIVSGNSGDYATKYFLTATGANLYNLISNYTGTVGLTGRGTNDYIPKFTSNGTGLINSVISQSGSNIAIGTAVANQTLTVGNTSDFQLLLGTSDSPISNFGYSIGRDRGGFGALTFSGSQSNTNGYIFGGINGRRLTIYSDGNVNIGTGIPISKLDVSGHILALNITGRQFYGNLTGEHITGWNINALNSLRISGQNVVTGGPYYTTENLNNYITSGSLPYYDIRNYSSSLHVLITGIGTGTKASVIIPVPSTITGNITIPPNFNLIFTNSGILNFNNDCTGIIRGPITSPNNVKIFNNVLSGQGTVAFTNNNTIINQSIDKFLLPWWGPPNDYSSDAQPYIQAAINALPENSVLYTPQSQHYLLNSTLSMSLRRGITLMTEPGNPMRNTNVGLPFSSLKWNGPAGGTMLDLDRAYKCKVIGWTFEGGGTGGADRIINIDGYSAGNICTENHIINNIINCAPRTGAKCVSISEIATNNVEFIRLQNNFFNAGGYRTGYGVWMGTSSNAHGHTLIDNNYYSLNHGIHMLGGNFQMEGLNNFGDNWVDIWMNDQTFPVTIRCANTENSAQFAYINGGNDTILIESNRIQCFGTVGSGIIEFGPTTRYVKSSSNDITSAAPGAYIYDCRNAQNLFLNTENNRYPDTYVNNIASGDQYIFKDTFIGNTKLVSNERGTITSQIKARGIKSSFAEYPPLIFDYVKSGNGTGFTSFIGLTTTPVSGAMEWDGANLYMTQHSGPTRRQLAYVTGVTGLTNFVNNLGITGRGTNNYVAKFTSDGTGIIIGSIFDTGNVGINTTTPREKLDVNGSFRMPRYRHFSMFRFVPLGSGAFSQLGYFSLNATAAPEGGQGNALIINATLQHDYASDDGQTAKVYSFTKGYVNTFSTWTELVPVLSSGPRAGTITDINLEASGNPANADFYLRLRTTAGNGGGNCRVNLECYDDLPFTEITYTGLDTGTVSPYTLTPLTSYAGRVGIKTSQPISAASLDVSGNIYATNIYSNNNLVLTGFNSGQYATLINLENTGQQAWLAANNNGINLSGNLTTTGVTLNNRIILLSGFLTGNTGQFYLASNPQNYATSGNLQTTGQAAWTASNNNAINLSGNLFSTGLTLNNKINSLSGYINSAASNIVYTTGNQTITGVKRFLNTGVFDSDIVISGRLLFPNPLVQPLLKDSLSIRYLDGGGLYIGDVDVGAGIDTVTVGSRQDNDGTISTAIGVANIVYTDYSVIAGNANEIGNMMGGKFGYVFGNSNAISQFNTGYGLIGNFNTMLVTDKTNLLAIGESNTVTESSCVALGFNLTNNVFQSVDIGTNNLTKATIESGKTIFRNIVHPRGGISGYLRSGDSGLFYSALNINNYATSGNIQATGQQAWLATNNNSINLSGNLATTGSILNNKINSLSGFATGYFVDLTSNQTIIGAKIFSTAVVLEDYLNGVNGSAINFIDPGGIITDDNGILTMQWTNRKLFNSAEISTLDWNNRNLSGNWTTNNLNILGTLTVSGQPVTGGGSSSSVNIPNILTGSGLVNYIPRFTSQSGLINSTLFQDSNNNIVYSGNNSANINIYNLTGYISWPQVGLASSGYGLNWFRPGSYGSRLRIDPVNGDLLFIDSSSEPGIERFKVSRAAGNVTVQGALISNNLSLGATTSYGVSSIEGNYYPGASAQDAIRFSTYQANGGSLQPRLTITTSNGNPGGGLVKIGNANLIISGSTSGIIITGYDIVALNSLTISGQSVITGGSFYGNNNPSGYITSGEYYRPTKLYSGFNPINIDWSSGNVFKYMLTGNVSLSHTNTRDGQTVVVGISNTGQSSYSGIWSTDIHWPNNTIPIQSTGAKMDIYTFIKITTGIYCTAVQGFGN